MISFQIVEVVEMGRGDAFVNNINVKLTVALGRLNACPRQIIVASSYLRL